MIYRHYLAAAQYPHSPTVASNPPLIARITGAQIRQYVIPTAKIDT